MSEQTWITEAKRHIGTREIPGARHEPKILQWWKAIKRGGIKTDEVPWCAAFVGGCLEAVGIVSSRFESARSYMTWGKAIPAPLPGCVVVFSRSGGGHVAFVIGTDKSGNLVCIGGNQGNSVTIAPFSKSRVVGYRWPMAVPLPRTAALPVLDAGSRLSGGEA